MSGIRRRAKDGMIRIQDIETGQMVTRFSGRHGVEAFRPGTHPDFLVSQSLKL